MGGALVAVFEWVKNLSGPLGLGGLLLYFVRDWRKTRLDTELAQKTLPSSVRVKDAEGDQATLVTIERAFAMERESRELTISTLREELDQVRTEGRSKDSTIDAQGRTIVGLRGQVGDLSAKLATLTGEVERLRARLARTDGGAS